VIAAKCTYIKNRGLGGTMAWSLDGDTANGELTTAMHNGLGQESSSGCPLGDDSVGYAADIAR
jgi:GH18 family chitinase